MKTLSSLFFGVSSAILLVGSANAYQVGVGIYDITGPSVEINFMGYAVPNQRGQGIHQRLKARAFVVEGDEEGDEHAIFVSVDGGMGSDLVNMKVIERTNEILGSEYVTAENLAISGTHTHSGPAGFLQYVLFQVTSFGFVRETFDSWVEGISQAIAMAHKDLKPANIKIGMGDLYDANINRSPTSYLRNPQEERDQYPEGDTDKRMLLLKFENARTKNVFGVFNWFAVHGTSMNNTNMLTSGDNRGFASYMLEREMNAQKEQNLPESSPFVAAFASTNLGDVSPNTNGAKCIDTGLPCEPYTSTCDGKCETCIAFGPGTNGDMVESTEIIGTKQYKFAKELMETADKEKLSGPVDIRHSFVNMPELNVTFGDGSVAQLCTPSMGYAFAAGTTDGPGMFNFAQGTTTGNPFWNKVRDVLSEPTQEEIDCQAPKPILLNTGDVNFPYAWDPHTVPIQILRIGNLFILSMPAELTTMAGRRLRNAVHTILQEGGVVEKGQTIHVTIAGLTNSYASYVTTFEEYQAQRYEAASTIYGPHTLAAYIQEFSRLAKDFVTGTKPSLSDPAPPNMLEDQWQLIPETRLDRVPLGKKFGDLVDEKDVNEEYKLGETVKATFHGANPRNDPRPEGTFLTVQRVLRSEEVGKETFVFGKAVAFDGDWSTRFTWLGGKEDPLDVGVGKYSTATLSWTIPADGKEGQELVEVGNMYRLCYTGDYKQAQEDELTAFEGCSSVFTIVE